MSGLKDLGLKFITIIEEDLTMILNPFKNRNSSLVLMERRPENQNKANGTRNSGTTLWLKFSSYTHGTWPTARYVLPIL